MEDLKVVTEQLPGMENAVLVRFFGNLEPRSISSVNKVIIPLIDQGCINLFFDCNYLEYITSPALGILISYYKETTKKEGNIRLFGLNDSVYEIFQIVGLTKSLKIFNDMEEAISDYEQSH